MYPLVPFYALPKFTRRRERRLCPAVSEPFLRLARNCSHHSQASEGPRVPRQAQASRTENPAKENTRPRPPDQTRQGWIEACSAADLGAGRRHPLRPRQEDLRSLSHPEGELYATDGICTTATFIFPRAWSRGRSSSAQAQRPFNLIDGSPARVPDLPGLVTYPMRSATAGS